MRAHFFVFTLLSAFGLLSTAAPAAYYSNKDGQLVTVQLTNAEAMQSIPALRTNGYIIRWFDVQYFKGDKPQGSSRPGMEDTFWSIIARKNTQEIDWTLVTVPRDKIGTIVGSYRNNGYRVKQIEAVSTDTYALLLYKQAGDPWEVAANLTASHHQQIFNNMNSNGYRLVQRGMKYAPPIGSDPPEFGGWHMYALYEKDGHPTWSKHSLTTVNMKSLFDFKATQGWYLTDLDVWYGEAVPYYVQGMGKPANTGGKPISQYELIYGMVFKKGAVHSKGVLETDLSASALMQKHEQLASQGYYMVLSVCFDRGGMAPSYTALWRQPSRVPPKQPQVNPDLPPGPGGFVPPTRPVDPLPPVTPDPQRNPDIPAGPSGLRPPTRPVDPLPPVHPDPQRNPEIPQGPSGLKPPTRPVDPLPPSQVDPERNPRIPVGPGGILNPLRPTHRRPKVFRVPPRKTEPQTETPSPRRPRFRRPSSASTTKVAPRRKTETRELTPQERLRKYLLERAKRDN